MPGPMKDCSRFCGKYTGEGMALYAIGDLHLSIGTGKSMEVFGGRWVNYMEKIKQGFSLVQPEDTVVLCGDLAWGMSLEQAKDEFAFINDLPGKKIILKGNHDYWWTTVHKAQTAFAEYGFHDLEILHNNCFFYNDIAICGTRGWFFEEEKGGEHDKKVMNREIMRLEASLKAAGDKTKYVFLHYPPKYQNYECPEILELFRKYEVPVCVYGHIHDKGCAYAFTGTHENTRYQLVSADHVYFIPQKIMD